MFVPGKPCLVHTHLRELLGPDYQVIFQGWVNAESTKSGQHKVASCLEHNKQYHDFPNVLIQILNVILYNWRSSLFPTLFLLILILNITDTKLSISFLSKPIPRMLEVLETSLFLTIKSSLGKLAPI